MNKLKIEDFNISEIESIELLGEQETIDICVADTHMFYANDIYTHNSGFNNLEIDEKNIGKAIEVFQVADFVIIYAQDRTMAANNECFALLFKNRLGPSKKGIRIRYNLFQGLYDEVGPLQDLADIFNRSNAETQATSINNIRERLASRRPTN